MNRKMEKLVITSAARGSDAFPNVFISYSQDSVHHKSQVEALAELLTESGVHAEIDSWQGPDRTNWGILTDTWLINCDFVIVVASPQYKLAAQGQLPSTQNRGAQSEAGMIREMFYRDRNTWIRKILPVVLPEHTVDEIPDFLLPHSVDHYIIPELTPTGIEDLLRTIHRRPRHLRPPLGDIPDLPPEPSARHRLATTVPPVATEPARIVWRSEFSKIAQTLPPTLEVHLVPAPERIRIGVSELQDYRDHLITFGRSAGLFTAAELVRADWSDSAVWACSTPANRSAVAAGIAIGRNGQRSAWTALPRSDYGTSIPVRETLRDHVATLLSLLLKLDVPSPESAAPGVGLEPLGVFHGEPSRDGFGGGRPMKFLQAEHIRIPATDSPVPLQDLRTRTAEVADELAARLATAFRDAR